jgi:hypothetical protein
MGLEKFSNEIEPADLAAEVGTPEEAACDGPEPHLKCMGSLLPRWCVKTSQKGADDTK